MKKVRIKGNREFKKVSRGITVIIIAFIGLGVLLISHADSPDVSKEAESGTLNGATNSGTDPKASGGQYVQLGTPTNQVSIADTNLGYANWYFPATNTGYTEMDTDFTPQLDGTPDGYFFSQQFWFMQNDNFAYGGYFGLQTEGPGLTGKVAIFSIWGATSATSSGFAGTFSNEGTGYSTRIAYPWVLNHTYNLQIRLGTQTASSSTWIATVTDTTTNVATTIGNIVVPATFGNLYPLTDNFHERYYGSQAACSDFIPSEVAFTNQAANGSKPTSGSLWYSTNSVCNGDFAIKDITDGAESIIGGTLP
jgi:hypothetical protein